MTALELRYHRATLDLLGEEAVVSEEAVAHLERVERARGIRFPASVREWYMLKGSVERLSEYGDHGVWLEHLGQVDRYWSGGAYHEIDLVAKGWLIFLVEIQSVYTWAVKLDGSDDPPVCVSVDGTMPFAKWEQCADTFSTFVYTYIWDHIGIFSDYTLMGWKPRLVEEDLAFLEEHFERGR